MGNIDKFLAKPVEVEIGGEKYNIKPFTVNDIATITKMGNKDSDISAEGFSEAVSKLMRQIDPEATDEQIKNISLEYLEDISNAIGNANNIDVDKAKADLIAKIKSDQQ